MDELRNRTKGTDSPVCPFCNHENSREGFEFWGTYSIQTCSKCECDYGVEIEAIPLFNTSKGK